MKIMMGIKHVLKKLLKFESSNFSNSIPKNENNETQVDIELINPQLLSKENIVKLAYLSLLRRRIDEGALIYWKQRIAIGAFNYFELVDGIYNSVEFAMNRVEFMSLLHKGRQNWCKSLDKYDYVFDIGGSSPNIDMGALIELGYSYRPKEISIFDLPEEEQYWGKPKFPQDRDYEFEWGKIHYEHGHIEDINSYTELKDKSYDLIYMGQTIEHIYKDKLNVVLKWIKNHLKPNGRFVFDTPNRAITRIQSPNQFIDKDHKYEYTPSEMEKILNKSGFTVIKKTGILNMPETLSSGRFNPLEVVKYELISLNAESGYVFAFECKVV